MSSPGGDQRRFHPHQLFLGKKLRQVDIPPRKLLARRAAATPDMPIYSPRQDEETLLQKYLPCNNPQDDEDDSELYSADQFRMYEFKVRRCTRSRSHDWTDCPFAHPGEKARRRDPRKYHYNGIICQDFRRGDCPRGDNCDFAHGVFECWLHPARYRTEACKDGTSCRRKVCFFAHTSKQLRILPPHYHQDLEGHQCRCSVGSPNSTLMRMPDVSPPVSPSLQIGGFSPIYRGDGRALAEIAELKRRHGPGYKKELLKIMESIQAMDMNNKKSANDSGSSGDNKNKLWVDVSNLNGDDQQGSFLSPSAPSSSGSSQSPSDPSSSGSGQYASRSYRKFDLPEEIGTDGAPDLGWVNELLFD
ncbi:zinc finger CCCH domain-containing protein 61-like [Apium graveolens]|uniref:C3H1-type domain-containing protein n=1 Tax=Apium graveolens TaxID=4045 RepID=A0A6L5BB36_APIGR|nr:hypothetical protein AG4045_030417 [Apium graveolens]